MDVPRTVTTALDDRPVAGATCLEAGAGVGNATAGLLEAGAARVYAVTNDREHARFVHERIDRNDTTRTERNDAASERNDVDRLAVLEADLRELPLAIGSVDFVTAHGLFNLVEPGSLAAIASELTRVASPGCHLVIDDYEPLPGDAAVREFFGLVNAIEELARGHPALTFYPAAVLRRLFAGYGWEFDRERSLLDPVPWTASHIDAHTAAARETAAELSGGAGESLLADVERLGSAIGRESVGEMYSVAMRLPPTA